VRQGDDKNSDGVLSLYHVIRVLAKHVSGVFFGGLGYSISYPLGAQIYHLSTYRMLCSRMLMLISLNMSLFKIGICRGQRCLGVYRQTLVGFRLISAESRVFGIASISHISHQPQRQTMHLITMMRRKPKMCWS
jgi:hypothetical protein